MKCQWCNTNNEKHFVTYYYRHDKNLCIRCVDKLNSIANGRDVNEFWEEADAKKEGFPPFPIPKYYKYANILPTSLINGKENQCTK